MATFKINAKNNTITLTASKGTCADKLFVAKWARNLMDRADAEVVTQELAYKLSASHLEGAIFVEEVTLSLRDYFFNDVKFWAKSTKK